MSARPSELPAPAASSGARRPARLTAAAVLVLVEALLAFGYAGYLVVESIVAPTEAPEIGWATAAFAVVCGLLLALVARGLARVRGWSRSPAVLAQLLLLPVGIPLAQGGQYIAGVPIVIAAVVGLVLLFTAGPTR